MQPFLQWESNNYYIFRVRFCSLSYSPCKAHASYYIVICGLSGCTIFYHIILPPVACLAVPYFTTLYCHLWPVWLYHILPHYIATCGLSGCTIFYHIILPPVACLAVPYFTTLSQKRHDFLKNVTEHKRFVLFFSTTIVWNFYYSKENWARCYNKYTSVFM